jgi:hypothetical protein
MAQVRDYSDSVNNAAVPPHFPHIGAAELAECQGVAAQGFPRRRDTSPHPVRDAEAFLCVLQRVNRQAVRDAAGY